MDAVIKHYLNKDIKEKEILYGGMSYQTYKLTLSDNQKIIFRAKKDYIEDDRKVVVSDKLIREKFFYDTVNKRIGHICPEIYIIDGTNELYNMTFCIMEYIEGTPLYKYPYRQDDKFYSDISCQAGALMARIHGIEIESNHSYIAGRGRLEDTKAAELHKNLSSLLTENLITPDEINDLVNRMRNSKFAKTRAFLHNDFRDANFIYRDNGELFLLDAELCDFGNPLGELVMSECVNWKKDAFIEGYNDAYGKKADIDSDLYYLYLINLRSFLYNLFNTVIHEPESKQWHLHGFLQAKQKLLC